MASATTTPPPVTETTGKAFHMFGSLRERNFRLLWAGNVSTFLGAQMQIVATGWVVLDLTDSPFYLGLAGLLSGLPVLVFSFLGGLLSDRLPRRRLLIVTRLSFSLLGVIVGVLLIGDWLRLWHLLAAAVAMGTIMALNGPATQTYIYDLVGRDRLLNAVSLNSAGTNLAQVIGPVVGGILVGSAGAGSVYLANGVTHGLAALLLFCIPVAGKTDGAERGPVWRELWEGLHYVRHHPTVGWLLGILATSIFGGAQIALMPVFARDILDRGAGGYGLLLTAFGCGAFIASLVIAWMGHALRKGPFILLCGQLFGGALILYAYSHWFVLSLVCQMLMGAFAMAWMAMINTAVQTSVTDELRGRVMSLYMMMLQAIPIGWFLAGDIASLTTATTALAAAGVCMIVVNAAVSARVPALRKLR